MIRDLILQNRTCRRFHQDVAIERETLRELVDLARYSASGANMQPLKYILSCEPGKNALIFPLLGFAGYLRDWPGPPEGERPSAYVIMLGDTEISKSFFEVDAGIAAQSILLGARDKGLGGCMHRSVKRDELSKAFGITSRYEILYVLSLGKPKEEVVLETIGPDGDCKYWCDSAGVHHVPKRRLDDIIIG
jgi:nitroreductase